MKCMNAAIQMYTGFSPTFYKRQQQKPKEKRDRGIKKKITKKAKLEAVATMMKTCQTLSNRYNLCLLFSCKKKKVNILLSKIDFIYITGVKPETGESTQSFSNKLIISISPSYLNICVRIGAIEE